MQRCLASLLAQDQVPDEIVVVDASEDHETQEVVRQSPSVRYVRFAGGAGNTPAARNEALRHVTGDVISYLDDDTVAHPGWSSALLRHFADPGIAAVAGRTLNGAPGEEQEGVEAIGQLLPDGRLTGHFAADPGRVVAVDHGIGANMAFRRTSLATLGGLRDVFPGTQMREETDVFLRLRTLGQRIVFAPDVVVDHLPAPHVKGKRFDLRYAYFAERNHAQMLAMNFGLLSSLLWRYVLGVLVGLPHADAERRAASRVVRAVVRVVALGVGVVSAARMGARPGRSLPVTRDDQLGSEIRLHLTPSGPPS